jgi:hypothetical protein
MRVLFFFIFLVLPTTLFSQVNSSEASKKTLLTNLVVLKAATKVATMDQYRFISIERDTTHLDTSPTIQENIALIICEKIILDFGFS